MQPNRPTNFQTWVLCERFRHVDGTFAEWVVVAGVAPAEHRSQLEGFERDSDGAQVSERRAFVATVNVAS